MQCKGKAVHVILDTIKAVLYTAISKRLKRQRCQMVEMARKGERYERIIY